MLGGQDTQQADAALLGIVVAKDAPFALWRQFVPLFQVMQHSLGQWRMGAAGAVGLDMPAVKLIAETLGIEWNGSLLREISAFEQLALQHWAKE